MRAKNPDPENYISISQAARTLLLSYQKVQRLFIEGKIRGKDDGGHYWLESQSVVDYSVVQDQIRKLEAQIAELRA
jgi:excisionase family DNA binding protein